MFAYGKNTTLEALKSQYNIREVFLKIDINVDERIKKIIDLTQEKKIKLTYIAQNKLTNLMKSDEHQGVGCLVEFEEKNLKEALNESNSDNNSFVYISSANDEHNVGAIIRTAECAGMNGVILPKEISITSTIAKTSTGALFHIPVITLSIFQTIKEMQKQGFKIIGIEREGELISKTDLTGNILLIIGGEDKSLTDQIRELCDTIVEIPQFGKVNSLNMSVASGIVIYESVRQKISSNIA